MEKPTFEEYITTFNQQVKKYIPPQNQWLPIDHALYTHHDLYRIPPQKAAEEQVQTIKYASTHHYTNNPMYQNFCKENNITPDNIRTNYDLEKIPLIPDKFFKDYPIGRDFATWLANIYTGSLPNIIINSKKEITFTE